MSDTELFEMENNGTGLSATIFRPKTANSYTPSRSLILLLPAQTAADTEKVGVYLRDSGWLRQARKDASVLIVPHSGGSWENWSPHFVVDLYQALWGRIPSIEPGDLKLKKDRTGYDPNSRACVWMWETLWSIIGYGDGADLAGDCVVAHPNRFACAALLGGAPHAFSGGEAPSDHFLVSKNAKRAECMVGVSGDYRVKMFQIPSAVWFVGRDIDRQEIQTAAEYFCRCDGIGPEQAENGVCCGMKTVRRANAAEPARRVWISAGDWETVTPEQLMQNWIGPSVRWKNSPDGTLKTFYWKDQVEQGESPYRRHTYCVPGEPCRREYYVYAPQPLPPKAPVMISIHGHGEPAWMFLSKNGWPQLADREGILIVSPESSGRNRWTDQADTDAFPLLLQDVSQRYDVDRQRIYISGFSNGNSQCYHTATKYAGLFAGMFPMSRAAGDVQSLQRLKASGLAMPLFGVTGDNDGWRIAAPGEKESEISRTIETFCSLAGKRPQPAAVPAPLYWQPDEVRQKDFYAERYGLQEADRFQTWIYNDRNGTPFVAVTVMKNMPHGSIWDESAAAWNFLKRFRRLPDGTLASAGECD